MITHKTTLRKVLTAIKVTGTDKALGLPILYLNTDSATILDKVVEIQLPETIEEFDRMASENSSR